MAMSYTVIFSSRQQFGDQPTDYADFVGAEGDFSFDCPDVNSDETGFLLFLSWGVQVFTNVFQINGVDVYGGLPNDPHIYGDPDPWSARIMLVEPHHNLQSTGNTMHIASTPSSNQPYDDTGLDDFILDNMVIVYKTVDNGGIRVPPGRPRK